MHSAGHEDGRGPAPNVLLDVGLGAAAGLAAIVRDTAAGAARPDVGPASGGVVPERAPRSLRLPNTAAPVLEGARYGGRPIYFSDVIVHVDSPFRSFLDLRGHSWAYNEPLSHSGYGITRYHLLELRRDARLLQRGDRSRLPRDVDERLVAAGEVDASAVDSQVLAVAMRDDVSLARSLRVIDALGPSTIQPVAVSKRVPAERRREIQRVLTTDAQGPGDA